MDYKTYNGWANYATWRVNLEIFDGMDVVDYLGIDVNNWHPYDLGNILKDYAQEVIEMTSQEGLARDYALAFLDEVDFREIAQLKMDEITT